MPDLLRLVELVSDKIKSDYSDQIAIAGYYGSYAQGTQTERSDIDIFFIPEDKQGRQLAECFILNDIGIDLFPVSWERAERIARFDEPIVSLIADCRLFYVRSDKDLRRFQALQQTITKLCEPQNRETMLKKAEKRFESVFMELYKLEQDQPENPLSFLRATAFKIMTIIFETLALINQEYLKSGWGKNLEQIRRFSILPSDFREKVDTLLYEKESRPIIDMCKTLVKDTREIIKTEKRPYLKTQNFEAVFAGYYEEIKSTFNKIIDACDRNDYEMAFFSSAHLQTEISELLGWQKASLPGKSLYSFQDINRFYRQCGFPDLLSKIKRDDLGALKREVFVLDKALLKYLKDNGLQIRAFQSFDDYAEHQRKK